MATQMKPQPETGQVEKIPIERIVFSKTNPRKTFDKAALAELAESIKELGIVQPLVVRPIVAGISTHELVVGERRLRAARMAGLLNALEEAEGYRELEKLGSSVEDLAAKVGKSKAYVYARLKLLALVPAAKKALTDGQMSAGHAILIARLKPQDQERVLDYDEGALFHPENVLSDPNADLNDLNADVESEKTASVRELDSWIARHIRFDPTKDPDPIFEPETVEALAKAGKVIPITYDYQVPPDARQEGKGRTYTVRSWKRADGLHKSKTCPRAVIGVVVIGPGRGQAFKVCVSRDSCEVHWAAELKAKKQREREVAKTAAATGENKEAVRQRKQAEEQQRQKLEEERWRKALPSVYGALAGAIKKAPAGAGGVVGKLVLEAFEQDVAFGVDAATKKLLPSGRTAEDLVRHMAFLILARDAEDLYDSERFTKQAKALGVDVKKVIEQANPAPKSSPKPITKDAGKKPAKKKASAKAKHK